MRRLWKTCVAIQGERLVISASCKPATMTRSTHEDGVTEACVLRIVNKSEDCIKAIWVDFDGTEKCYMEIESGHARPQQTFTTHVWRLRSSRTDALVGEYSGSSAVLEVQPLGGLSVRAWSGTPPQPKPEWGEYSKRGEALGIGIWSYACVDPRAIRIAEHIVRRMLEASPPGVVRRMESRGALVALIGRNQVTTDIPAHAFMRWSEGGRDTDSTTRGLGGTAESPTTSCGEENLLMEDDRYYTSENILVHEFGHAVMNIGLTSEDRAAIRELYQAAYSSGLYDIGAYVMENEEEYWAEGTQAWFDATIRVDVTSGVNTREKLRQRDPGLASMMQRAYGDGAWRYPHDSPAPFHMHRAQDVMGSPAVTQHTAMAGSAACTPSHKASTASSTAAAATAAQTASTTTVLSPTDRDRIHGALLPHATVAPAAAAATAAAVSMRAPGVEDTMERSRFSSSSFGGGVGCGWLQPRLPSLSGCFPGSGGGGVGGGGSGGGGLPAACMRLAPSPPRPLVAPGCGTALWAALRGTVVGHAAHSTVKLS